MYWVSCIYITRLGVCIPGLGVFTYVLGVGYVNIGLGVFTYPGYLGLGAVCGLCVMFPLGNRALNV